MASPAREPLRRSEPPYNAPQGSPTPATDAPRRAPGLRRAAGYPGGGWLPWASLAVFLAVWEAAVRLTGAPAWVLPPPSRIATTLVTRFDVIAPQAVITLSEILAGFAVGVASGVATALLMARWRLVERAVGPLMVASQAMPVFAIAPLLVVWLGFGLASKVAMAAIIIFFPVATNFLEGLRRTDRGLIDLATLYRASELQRLRLIRIPAALPALASGLRIAAAVAPIGAVVGEWVGASSGLGLLILHANARMQTDLVFAALAVLALLSIALWAAVDAFTRRLVRWAPDTLHR